MLEIAEFSSGLLLRHINDVLDIAKIESGKFELVAEPFNLNRLIEHVVDLSRPLAAMRETTIVVDTTVAEPSVFSSDQLRVQQITLNLVGNAVKFTEKGQIRVRARELISDRGQSTLELVVEDTGIGIAKEDQQRIFDDFVAVDHAAGRSESGTGLGLSITRRIVMAMSGELGVISAPGEGSRFWVRLPISRLLEPASEPSPAGLGANWLPGPKRPIEVLIVEDNDINRFVATEMLKSRGCIVSGAVDGPQGVLAAEQQSFDLIFMDISMPGMDGLEACRTIRSGAGASRHSPIVGLTAHAMPEERQRYLAVGMNACLIKPLRRSDLDAVLAEHVPRNKHRKAHSGTGSHTGSNGHERPVELVDVSIFAELCVALPRSIFDEKLTAFAGEMETGLAEVAAALDHGDHRRARDKAHKLAGLAALFGASRLRRLLLNVENACGKGDVLGATTDFDSRQLVVSKTIETLMALSASQ